MLALAKYWSESAEKPACNLLFAAWTAEEKGLIGSSYFVDHNNVNPENTVLKINFDMISRSAPEDSTGLIISIGTAKGSDNLKALANQNNQLLAKPFTLDLWECSEHGGSDYAPFAGQKVPVMTFFSGFHDDYHSIRDISIKADLDKMKNILNLANGCLEGFMKESVLK
jgi:Zn-dependent M28 family amino/carboxypeptidase